MSDLFDNLRSDGSSSMTFEEEEGGGTSANRFNDFSSYEDLDDDPRPREEQKRRGRRGKHFLGMTPGQRFILVFLLFVLSMMFSSACLVLTGKVVIF